MPSAHMVEGLCCWSSTMDEAGWSSLLAACPRGHRAIAFTGAPHHHHNHAPMPIVVGPIRRRSCLGGLSLAPLEIAACGRICMCGQLGCGAVDGRRAVRFCCTQYLATMATHTDECYSGSVRPYKRSSPRLLHTLPHSLTHTHTRTELTERSI